MKFNKNYFVRWLTGLNNNHPVIEVEGKGNPCKCGHSYYFTTPSGKTIVHHPSAYGYRTLYHHSTLCANVGKNWMPKIPKGMEIRNDKQGFFLCRLTDGMDFHFTPQDYRRKDFVTWARKQMAANYSKRLQAKALEKLFQNSVKNTYVNFSDARRAGNCVSGIIQWAKLKLNLSENDLLDAPWITQVPAKTLLRLDPDNNLVKNSINQAYLRETMVSI